jgi:hypothetical protein
MSHKVTGSSGNFEVSLQDSKDLSMVKRDPSQDSKVDNNSCKHHVIIQESFQVRNVINLYMHFIIVVLALLYYAHSLL